MSEPESVPVVIVGAGPAGLASAAAIGERDIDFVVLERGAGVGHVWRNHYDRLHLHTNRSWSELPGMHFRAGTGRYPSRQQVVDYLQGYADRFDITDRVQLQTEVTSIRRDGDAWLVEAGEASWRSACVVVATGYTRVPHRPTWPGLDDFPGEVLHSSEYKNGEPFRGQRVLVVGFGNSGGEIAICLHEHGARPGIAVRGRVNVVPRDLLGLPILAVGISLAWLPSRIADAISWPLLAPTFRRARRAGLRLHAHGVFTQIRELMRIPLLDIGTIELMESGAITGHRGVERFEGNDVVFTDGEREPFDAVVLATGYRARLDALVDVPGVLDDEGLPHRSGAALAGAPGLFFVGYYLAPTGMFREIALEAPRVAEAIAARV